MSELPKIIIGVPGPWADSSELVAAVVEKSGGYLFAGMVLMHTETQESFELHFTDADPQFTEAFGVAGTLNVDEGDVRRVADHAAVLYLLRDGGSLEAARSAMRAASALLDCGGIGVKVESTGVAFPPETWRQLTEDAGDEATRFAFTTLVGGDGEFYSCGMHNIGERDAVIKADVPPDEAAAVLDAFNRYVVLERPTLLDGQTFSLDEDAPRYRFRRTDCDLYDDPEDSFHNPYGMWELTPTG